MNEAPLVSYRDKSQWQKTKNVSYKFQAEGKSRCEQLNHSNTKHSNQLLITYASFFMPHRFLRQLIHNMLFML